MKVAFSILLFFSGYISFGQAGSEIYLFDLKVTGGQLVISNGKNITNHKGYDNQPFFHPSKPLIYFSSFNDSGRSDIKYFNIETKETKNLTTTHGGRKFNPPSKMPYTRPTTDIAKEGLFNILQHKLDIEDLKTLDLFGGTGNISYELASRGAKELTIVEKDTSMYELDRKSVV